MNSKQIDYHVNPITIGTPRSDGTFHYSPFTIHYSLTKSIRVIARLLKKVVAICAFAKLLRKSCGNLFIISTNLRDCHVAPKTGASRSDDIFHYSLFTDKIHPRHCEAFEKKLWQSVHYQHQSKRLPRLPENWDASQ